MNLGHVSEYRTRPHLSDLTLLFLGLAEVGAQNHLH